LRRIWNEVFNYLREFTGDPVYSAGAAEIILHLMKCFELAYEEQSEAKAALKLIMRKLFRREFFEIIIPHSLSGNIISILNYLRDEA